MCVPAGIVPLVLVSAPGYQQLELGPGPGKRWASGALLAQLHGASMAPASPIRGAVSLEGDKGDRCFRWVSLGERPSVPCV